jgi:hypothetical protein
MRSIRPKTNLLQVTGALVLAICLPQAHGLPITESFANVSAPGPFSSQYTTQPGEWLWATGTSQNSYVPASNEGRIGYGPIAFGNAHTNTVIGANRLRLNAQFVTAFAGYPEDASSATFYSTVDASALSRWYDTWRVTGLPDGSPVKLTLSGTVDFSIYGSLYWPLRTSGYDIKYSVFVQGADAVTLTTPDFDTGAGPGSIDWTYSFEWTAGTPVLIGSILSLDTLAGPIAALQTCVVCVGDFFFDSSNTAKFGLIEVSDGASLQSESGYLKLASGGAGYIYDSPAVSPIPEPTTFAMLLVGLLIVNP